MFLNGNIAVVLGLNGSTDFLTQEGWNAHLPAPPAYPLTYHNPPSPPPPQTIPNLPISLTTYPQKLAPPPPACPHEPQTHVPPPIYTHS